MKFTKSLSNGVPFYYSVRTPIPVHFLDGEPIPYFMKSGEFEDTSEMCYVFAPSGYARGLITLEHLKEVMSGAAVPHCFMFKDSSNNARSIIAGKYYLGVMVNNTVETLFAGMCERDSDEVIMYVSRSADKIYQDLIEDVIGDFNGVIVTAPKIDQFFGRRIELPVFKTVDERKTYISEMLGSAIDEIRKDYEK